jgi:hypothetical protein
MVETLDIIIERRPKKRPKKKVDKWVSVPIIRPIIRKIWFENKRRAGYIR